MKSYNLNKDILSELIEVVKKNGLNNFYFKNELLEIKVELFNAIMNKGIIEDEIIVDKNIGNNKLRKVIIKSEYVARIKLENKENIKFVKIGDKVRKGQKLGEYEYLNIIFDINSSCDGIVTEIYINHNEIVDYNKSLFLINTC